MTCIRSYARRGLARDIEFYSIPEGDEIAWLTEFVCHNEGLELLTGSYIPCIERCIRHCGFGNDSSPKFFRSRPYSPQSFDYTLPEKLHSPIVFSDHASRSPISLRNLLQISTAQRHLRNRSALGDELIPLVDPRENSVYDTVKSAMPNSPQPSIN